MKQKLGTKTWLSIIIFSLVGQIAWTMENMFYNLYILDEFRANPSSIALMVSLSAITATLTTLFMGVLSDKLGKRKILIICGYFLWGITILSFIFVNNKYISSATLGIALVILLDCIMTFFGSTANDAAYNAYLTEISDNTNRGKIEGVNSAMPLISILIVFGGLSSFAKIQENGDDTWYIVFIIIGALVLASGIIGIFTIKEPKVKKSTDTPYFKNIIYGFKPSVIKDNKKLYIILLAFAIFGISLQVYMPYYIIYLQNAGIEIEFAKAIGFDSYVIIMAPAIVIAAIFTIIYGRIIDKFDFIKSLVPVLILYSIGLLLLSFLKSTAFLFLGCLFMMMGYLASTASFNAAIRKYTPEDKVGLFQGLRIISSVLIPMLIGPWIGSTICGGGALFGVTDEGFKVSQYVFLGGLVVILLIAIPLAFVYKIKDKENKLYTLEFEKMNKELPLSEYPFPQFKRESYLSLNGLWKYKISRVLSLDNINDDILVPFPVESTASLANKRLNKNEYIIYKRNFKIQSDFIKDRVFINFIGVDQKYYIILNGMKYDEIIPLGLPTKIDITDSIKEDNELIVVVQDNLDCIFPLGKQAKNPKGIFYTPYSGIYYPVYIESVSDDYIKNITLSTSLDSVSIDIDSDSDYYEIQIKANDTIINSLTTGNKNITIKIDHPIPWDTQNPFLYDIEIKTKNDKISSYFGLREIRQNDDGFIYLNNKRIFLNGVLDQGYYPEGIITPSTYESVEFDILTIKELGFNTIRKHIKIEIPYFYYLCDKHGILVLQDFVNSGKYSFFKDTALPTIGLQNKNDTKLNKNTVQRDFFIKAGISTINLLANHPSIVGYTIFNEGWGQFDSDNVYKKYKSLYPAILFDSTSGWFHGSSSDFISHHWYFKNLNNLQKATNPIFLSEFGALCYKVEDHCFSNKKVFGYKYFDTLDDVMTAFTDLYQNKIIPYKDKLVGIIYTQLSDIEEEDNGILTYDRKVLKLDKDKVKEILKRLNN